MSGSLCIYAQENQPDTTARRPGPVLGSPKHSPKKATLLSTFIPGAGQIYNRKNWWWKVPIIYGGGGALVYGIVFYQKNYNDFRQAYKYRVETKSTTNGNARFDQFQTPTLQLIRDSYKEARDQCIISIVGLYALQILDAAVEAHFFEFNVSDDLSLGVQPVYIPYGTYAYTGLQLTLNLK